MRHKGFIICAIALVPAAMCAGAAFWITGQDSRLPTATAPKTTIVAPQGKPAPALGYKRVNKMCPWTSAEMWNDLYPGLKADIEESEALLDEVRCRITWGDPGHSFSIQARAEIWRNSEEAASWFETLQAGEKNPRPVRGLGTEAVAYDGVLGPTLAVLHGNMRIEINLSTLMSKATVPADVDARLAKTAEYILDHFPVNS